ncbi:MAG: FAD-dependent oxidoreductase [bacterium]|nr:FAD-dependent oxidoreductase [bacterium]
MKVAIIGSGISGLVCAHRLHRRHDVHVFERNDWIGGHTHTVDVPFEGTTYSVDTGFIVYNERNYPHFSALLEELGVETQPTRMTFGFRSERTRLEYSGSSLRGLFAQRSNLVRPRFWSMLSEILRFFREAKALLASSQPERSLGEFLDAHGFGRDFQQEHLLPMGAAIWSCPPDQMRAFPAERFARFFANHGLLSLRDRPQWRVVSGGSARYVEKLTRPFLDRIRLGMPVQRVVRDAERVELIFGDGSVETFDSVVFACHSDEALGMLADASPLEKDVLGAIRYQPNDVVLHTDAKLLPRHAAARSAWNYHVPNDPTEAATVTYDMNRLQGIEAPVDFLVTLNSSEEIDPEKVIGRYAYAHPVFDRDAIRVQRHQDGLGAERRSAFCGAYWGYGFHEDGVRSGLVAAEQIERLGA